MEPELAEKIDEIIKRLDKYKEGEAPFTLILRDVSGNSFIENPFAPEKDPAMTFTSFQRSVEESESLGISEEMVAREKGFPSEIKHL